MYATGQPSATYDAAIANGRISALPLFGLGLLALALAAVASARVVASQPEAALAAPVVLALAVVAGRAPSVAGIGLVITAGVSGSFFAYTDINPQLLVDGLLAGLWSAVAWRLFAGGESVGRRAVWPAVAVTALFLVISLAEVATASSLGDGLRSFRGQQWLMTVLLLPSLLGWGTGTGKAVLRGTVVVGAAVAGYACFRYAIGSPTPEELSAAVQANRAYAGARSVNIPVIGTFGSEKTLGLWAAVLIPVAAALVLTERRWWRGIGAATVLLSAVALFGSETRTALVGGIFGLLVVVALAAIAASQPGARLGRSAVAVGVSVALLIGGFAVAARYAPQTADRFTELRGATSVESYEVRRERWRQVLGQVEKDPFGGGLATSSIVAKVRATGSSVNIDSSYVKIAAEQGVVVVIFISGLLWLLITFVVRVSRQTDAAAGQAGIAAGGALAAMGVLMYATIAAEQLPSLVVWLVCGVAIAELSRVNDAPDFVESADRPLQAPAPAVPA